MALINNIIPAQNYEIVENRIAEIAANELLNQYNISYDEDLIYSGVYVERTWPVQLEEGTVINVLLQRGMYDNKDVTQVDGTYQFIIDIYCSSKSIGNNDGDKLARTKMLKIYGKLRYIFSSPVYNNLAFARPFLCRSKVTDLMVKPASEGDTGDMMSCRLVLSVEVPENIIFAEPHTIEGYQTMVKLSQTDKGYLYN